MSALLHRGGVAIYPTRWLLTALAVPTNLAAGGGGYPFVRFLAFDVAGEVTWILVFGGLGYAFGSQWEVIGRLVSNFSGLLVGIVFVLAGVYFLAWRRFPKQEHLGKKERFARVRLGFWGLVTTANADPISLCVTVAG